jgi:hypothetical protein
MRGYAEDIALVRCPSCDARATVHWSEDGLRLACPACGHAKTAPWPRRHYERGPNMGYDAYEHGDAPFGAALWLEVECCGGNRLWALNERHIDYLQAYVAETQREREFPSPPGNRQLAYKLPKWMKLAKNRDEIIRSIERLRATL